MNEEAAHRTATMGTLREALWEHPAGPELVAVLGPLADRPAPAGWMRWSAAQREDYLDEALDVARTQRLLARSTADALLPRPVGSLLGAAGAPSVRA